MLTTLQGPTVREELARIETEHAAQVEAAAVALPSSAYLAHDQRGHVEYLSGLFTAHFDAVDRVRAFERRVEAVARQIYNTDREREEKKLADFEHSLAVREEEFEGVKEHVIARIKVLDEKEEDL